MFSGLLFCADCGGKLHFATSKSFEGKQDHYVCNNYKSNRGTCTAHYIREDVLREIVLERIRAVNEYIRSDVDGFQEEWLQCRRTDQERSIRDDKKKLEQAKKRLADLDVIIARLYEDYVLGNLNQDRYRKMSADYEAEQERLKLEIEVIEEWVEQREEMNDGLDAFIALTQKYVDVEELTQTIVNEYIKKIIVYAPTDKSLPLSVFSLLFAPASGAGAPSCNGYPQCGHDKALSLTCSSIHEHFIHRFTFYFFMNFTGFWSRKLFF